ncbi:MAG: hypothetical protein R3195_05765 [Gemmatimonadota bacterium]|nr:hypothetical protein [Gemmatimonadota bacterium]
MKKVRLALFAGAVAWAVFFAVPAPAHPQGNAAEIAAAAGWPEADPADVESVDAIIEALYDVISGPAGEARDWDRFKSLMAPQARLIPTGRGQNGVGYQAWTPDQYAEQAGAFLEQRGFFEVEAARTTDEFGQIAHAFSTYESRWNADDEEPFDRGINSIQLLNDGDRWWILNIFWAAESSGLTIPDRYLRDGG